VTIDEVRRVGKKAPKYYEKKKSKEKKITTNVEKKNVERERRKWGNNTAKILGVYTSNKKMNAEAKITKEAWKKSPEKNGGARHWGWEKTCGEGKFDLANQRACNHPGQLCVQRGGQ